MITSVNIKLMDPDTVYEIDIQYAGQPITCVYVSSERSITTMRDIYTNELIHLLRGHMKYVKAK